MSASNVVISKCSLKGLLEGSEGNAVALPRFVVFRSSARDPHRFIFLGPQRRDTGYFMFEEKTKLSRERNPLLLYPETNRTFRTLVPENKTRGKTDFPRIS
ncbi:hypothetical protein ABEB36_004895 [Hypothenemus hampei]|uniref:Uncharacterized protein n=1 Tax=Hypothenemus hampei TaxID=57062 RepID=A0ABD1EW81_HYPHA